MHQSVAEELEVAKVDQYEQFSNVIVQWFFISNVKNSR